MVSVVKEARANGSRLSPNLAQSLLWKGLTSSWSVHRSEICKPWCRQARPNQLVLVPLLNQGKNQIIIKDVFHCTGWQQHKPYFGSRLRHTLKGTFQIDLMGQLDSLLGDLDSPKPPSYLSPRNSTFTPSFLSLNCPLSVSLLWVWTDTLLGTCKYWLEMKTGKNITCMILA